MRLVFALALVLVEYLLISVALDSSGTPWGHAAALAVAVACAVVLFAEQTRRAILVARVERRTLALHGVLALGAAVVIAFVRSPLVVTAVAICAALPLLLPVLRIAFADRRAAIVAAIVGAAAFVVGLNGGALWPWLARWTLRGVAVVLHGAGVDVIEHVEEGIVGTPAFVVRVDPTCSGMEGLGLMLVFVGVGLYGFRRELVFPRAWLLVPTAAALVLALNVLRISVLIGVGHAGAPDLALGGFHSRAGWVGFCAVAALVVEVARRSRWLRSAPRRGGDAPAVAYLAPVAALLAGKLVVPLLSTDVTLALVWRTALGELVRGRGGPVVAIVAGVIVYIVWRAFGAVAPPEAPSLATWGLHFAVSVFLIPVVEELAFRGYLLRRLFTPRFEDADPARAPLWSVFASALVFGVAHERFAAAVLAGLVFAWVYRRRGRLLDAVLAHAVANAAIALEVMSL